LISHLKSLLNIGTPRDSGFKLGMALTLLQGASAVGLMAASAWLISRAAEHPPVMFLNIAVVLVRGLALGRAFFRYTERIALHNSAFKMQTGLRKALYKKIVPLAPVGLTGVNRASTVTNFVNDVDELQNLPLRVLAPLLQASVVSVATVGYLAFIQPQAALALFGALALVALAVVPLSARFARKAGEDSAPARAYLAEETSNLLENLDVLQAYGWAEQAATRVTEASERILKVNRTQAITSGFGSGMLALLASATTAITTYFGAVEVLNGGQPRVMLAVIALLPLALFDLVTNALPAITSWQRYKSSAARVQELLSAEPAKEILGTDGGLVLDGISSIELTGVSAKYPNQLDVAIEGVSLKLEPGQTLQLKGPSGKGKTTIALLLTGFLNPHAGSFKINGVDAAAFDQGSLRSSIGYLEQSPTIFLGTLRDNLLIGDPTATDEQLQAVLERVGLRHTFVGRAGLDTQLGERGFAISGGEAQRVALARALLADFQVLIFDEPTANVDTKMASSLWLDLFDIVAQDQQKAAIFITHETLPSERFSQVITL
jgi:ATP-binding cassette subfamily C protein CydC